MISVIIPVYNVEKYLNNCVKSVIGQSYKDLEIILVDDGSTDNSGIICDFLKEKDNRIIVIHKKMVVYLQREMRDYRLLAEIIYCLLIVMILSIQI